LYGDNYDTKSVCTNQTSGVANIRISTTRS